ncbi:formate--tetrahydrofolate ligase, partial [Mycobacterium tuberculosis]|nr:formate--tetrahydrofolate ligase [Mycobacterium tuberculosis]
IQQFGLPYTVAINRFTSDADEEIDALLNWCAEHSHPAALSEVWEKGGAGGIELAEKVIQTIADNKNQFSHLYELSDSIEAKVEK